MSRTVTKCGRDQDGDIIRLCNPAETWGPRTSSAVINDIESDQHTYYSEYGGIRARIYVKSNGYRKYLTTSPDGTTRNNLDDLPAC